MKFVLKKPITVLLFYIAALLIGIGALYNLPVELIPQADFPKVTVYVSWPFTSPKVIESQVVAPLEREIQRIPGIHKISSVSRTGSGYINIELNREVDSDFFTFELQQKISILRDNLPSQYIHISVQKYVPEEYQSEEFMSFSMVGDMPPHEITRIFHDKVLPVLLAIKGVSHANLPMEQYPQLLIKIDKKKCEKFGLPFHRISQFIREYDMVRFLGSVHLQDQQLSLLFKNQLKNSLELRDIVLESHRGRLIRLSDVAEVIDTVTTLRYITRINGKNALLIQIQKESGANSLTVSRQITKTLKELESKLDHKIEFVKESDQSETIRKNLRNLWYRSTVSLLVIFLVLLFFLSDLRSPLVILSSILFSLLLTFIVFYLFGYTLNLFSLAGLALGFGMLVDNSIVVLESIFHFREKGDGKIKSILKSVKSVKLPVMAASLTTVAALIPIVYLTGELKLYYYSFVRAVVISLLSSIIVSFTLIPLIAFIFMKWDTSSLSNRTSASLVMEERLSRMFRKWLEWTTRHPRWIIILCILWFGLPIWKLPERLEHRELKDKAEIEQFLFNKILVPVYNFIFDHEFVRDIRPTIEKMLGGTSYWFFKHVEIGEMWRWGFASGYVGVAISMPEGTDPEFTVKVMRQFENRALAEKGIRKVTTRIWPGGGFMKVDFTEKAMNSIIPYIVKEKLIQLATNFAGFAVNVFGYGMGYSSGYGTGDIASYRFELRGYNYQEMEQIAIKIKEQLSHQCRIRNININASGSYWNPRASEEVVLEVDRMKLGNYGLRVNQFLSMVQQFLQQENWFQKITIGEDEIIFNLKEKNANNFTISDLKNTILQLPDGERIRIGDIAIIKSKPVEPEIKRENQEYLRYISFEFIGPPRLGNNFIDNFLKSISLPPGYSLKKKEFFYSSPEKKFSNIGMIILLSILLVYMVTAALFESYRQPFLILFAIPMALTGVFLVFFLTGRNFDQSAMIGVILLSGIVVNNSILLVYHVDELKQKLNFEAAIIQGTIDRVRPILMTTLTTVLGMLPLVLLSRSTGNDSDVWGALALASIGGLITSTIFVLLAMPAILKIFGGRKEKRYHKDNPWEIQYYYKNE